MRFHTYAASALFVATAMSALGCAVDTSTDATTESVGQTKDDLSVYQWAGDYPANNSHSYNAASIATFTLSSGSVVTFMVHTANNYDDHNMYWAFSSDGIGWTTDTHIDNMYSSSSPQLAAFNGYLYMVHTGDHDNSVWMSRFNESTWSWGQDFQIPFQSTLSPSLASFNGSLYLVGTRVGTGQIWQATMSTSEVFSAATDVPGAVTNQFSPSLAVGCSGSFCYPAILYMAYKTTAGELGMSGLQQSIGRRGGTPAWWTPWVVANADGTHKTTWNQPALASYNGMLHIVRTVPASGDRIIWTYYDGSQWSTDVSIGNQEMWGPASLAPRPERLVMVHPANYSAYQQLGDLPVYAEYFQ